jgi:hypothetical protein
MKMKLLRCVFVAAIGCGIAIAASAGDLKMSMQNGRVTIMADNVPLRQILQEWARLGQTNIVNIDKVNGPAVSLQLVDTPEKDALDIILRSASGYIAAPRPVEVANASIYDRITIMAASHPPAAVASAAPPPTFQRPPQPVEEDEPLNVVPNPNAAQNPVIGQYPGMPPQIVQPGMPPAAPAVQSQPGMPAAPQTLSKPGMLPTPTLPNGVPNPYQPQVIRPGGGGGGGF